MANYFVKNGGSDANTGLSDVDAFETLEYAHNQAVAGDTISLKRGSSWFGFTPQKAGGVGNPITWDAYGVGEKPVIKGLKELTGWTDIGGGYWRVTDLDLQSRTHFLRIDGTQYTVARWPRDNYNQFTGSTDTGPIGGDGLPDGSSGTITAAGLSGSDFINGEVVIRKKQWVIDVMDITNHSASTLTCSGGSFYKFQTGWGYAIQNHRDVCTVELDWCQEGNDIVIYMGALNPASYTIEAPVLQGINFSSHGENVYRDTEFRGFNGGSDRSNEVPVFLYNNSQNVKFLSGCEFNQMGNTVHYFEATNNSGFTIDDCSFQDCLNMAFWNRYSSSTPEFTITNNILTNIGNVLGAGGNSDNGYKAIMFAGSSDPATVTGNRLINIGYCGFDYGGFNFLIEKNYVENSCSIKADGGAFYTYGKSDDTKPYVTANRIIRNNIAIDSPGNAWGTQEQFDNGHPTSYFSEAFYFDDNTKNITFQSNLGKGCRSGLKGQNIKDCIIINNTFFDNDENQVIFANNTNGDFDVENLTFTGNVLYAKTGQLTIEVESDADNFNIIGTFDNNYYMRPSNEAGLIRHLREGVGGFDNYLSLAQWKATDLGGGTFQDANSSGTPTASTVSNLFFNDTLNNGVSVDIGRRRVDVDGTLVLALSLDGFEFALLLDDLGPLVVNPPGVDILKGIRFVNMDDYYGAEIYAVYNLVKTNSGEFRANLPDIKPIADSLLRNDWDMANTPFGHKDDQVYSLVGVDLTLSEAPLLDTYTATGLINIAVDYSILQRVNGVTTLQYIEPGAGTLKTYVDGVYIGSEAFAPSLDLVVNIDDPDILTAIAYKSGTLTEGERLERSII